MKRQFSNEDIQTARKGKGMVVHTFNLAQHWGSRGMEVETSLVHIKFQNSQDFIETLGQGVRLPAAKPDALSSITNIQGWM